MSFLERLVSALQNLFRKEKLNLETFNTLGLDTATQPTDAQKTEMKLIIDDFNKFVTVKENLFQSYIRKYLYGNLTEAQATEILRKYPTVSEGMEQIPGRVPKKEQVIEQRNNIIIPLLEKLAVLKIYGEENKLYRDDFVVLKRLLLNSLFQQFGSAEDIPNLQFTIDELKKLDMVPSNITFVQMTQYCALGRWY